MVRILIALFALACIAGDVSAECRIFGRLKKKSRPATAQAVATPAVQATQVPKSTVIQCNGTTCTVIKR